MNNISLSRTEMSAFTEKCREVIDVTVAHTIFFSQMHAILREEESTPNIARINVLTWVRPRR